MLSTEKTKKEAMMQMSEVLEKQKVSQEEQQLKLERTTCNERKYREYSTKEQLSSIQKKLMRGTYSESGKEYCYEKPNELQNSLGYIGVSIAKDVYSEGTFSLDLDFLLEELVKYAQGLGYTGFDENRFKPILGKIESFISQMSKEYSDKKVQYTYVLHGLLASELCTRFIGFCRYIEENNIDTRYTWSKTKTRCEWDNKYTTTNTVTDFFQQTIEGIAVYTGRVCGDEYKNQFLEQVGSLNKSKEYVIKK